MLPVGLKRWVKNYEQNILFADHPLALFQNLFLVAMMILTCLRTSSTSTQQLHQQLKLKVQLTFNLMFFIKAYDTTPNRSFAFPNLKE